MVPMVAKTVNVALVIVWILYLLRVLGLGIGCPIQPSRKDLRGGKLSLWSGTSAAKKASTRVPIKYEVHKMPASHCTELD